MSKLQDLEARYNGEEEGYTYLMEFRFVTKSGKSKILYKVGVTKNKPIDRMLEIARSFFMERRYVPECRLVRYRKSASYREKEKVIHGELADVRHNFSFRFSGYTEFFDIDRDTIIDVYERSCPKIEKDERLGKSDA